MSAHCCSAPAHPAARVDPRFRKALWVALVLNALMFAVELGASWTSGSVALVADSIDFFGDAANYALTLAVLGLAASARSRAALVKAATMGAVGLAALGAGWPDLAVAAIMASLALSGAWAVLRQARQELRAAPARVQVPNA